MTTGTPRVGRFEWERALLNSELPWHLKAFLLLLGTKMDVDGRNCRPSAPWLMAKVGKKAAGRELDGRTWDEFPERVA